MSATEVLHRMLDERRVEWGNIRNDGSESDYLTEWQFENNQGKAIAIEWAVGSGLSVEIHRYHLTPEQAIAATLGLGMLTADDVRDLIERHSYASGGNGRDFHNGAYAAIADELNNMLGSCSCTNGERTNAACKPVTYDNGYSTDHLEPGEYHEFWEPACACGNCGELIPMRKFCPNCGCRLEVEA